MKKRRISVPISHEIRCELEHESAQKGVSVSSLLEQLIKVGREKTTVVEQLDELITTLQNNHAGESREEKTDPKTAELIQQIASKIEQLPSQKQAAEGGIFLKAESFIHLFSEVYFSAFLSASLAAETAPGAARQPVSMHLQNARTKAKAAVQQFLNLEAKK